MKSDISEWVLRDSEAGGQRANCLMEPVVVGKVGQAIVSHHNGRGGIKVERVVDVSSRDVDVCRD